MQLHMCMCVLYVAGVLSTLCYDRPTRLVYGRMIRNVIINP
jgi:hypothetical protein